MSTPRRLRGALENYFGGADQEIMNEILGILELHFSQQQKRPQIIPENIPAASPWIFSQDAQPDVGVEVIVRDPDTLDSRAQISTAARTEGSDWTDPEAAFWWMPIPPLPEGGLLRVQESAETRMDAGVDGGAQGADYWWWGRHAKLSDAYAESEAAAATLHAQCAPHKEIQAAVNVANTGRAALLDHARAILALHNQNTNKEADHVV